MCSAARIDPHRAGPCDPMGRAEPPGTVPGHTDTSFTVSVCPEQGQRCGPISPLCANSWSQHNSAPWVTFWVFFFFLPLFSLSLFFLFILTWHNQAGGEASGFLRYSVLHEPGGERGNLVTCHVGAVAFTAPPKQGEKHESLCVGSAVGPGWAAGLGGAAAHRGRGCRMAGVLRVPPGDARCAASLQATAAGPSAGLGTIAASGGGERRGGGGGGLQPSRQPLQQSGHLRHLHHIQRQ